MITILGPTASGKTNMAITLAKEFSGEIICADSRTVYKDMDIGTAKPTIAEQKTINHHLLDMVEPGNSFNVSRFKELAVASITDIQDRGKMPFLVGGSGLYIDSILFDYQFDRAGKGKNVRLNNLSIDKLQMMVSEQYPELELNNSELNNPRRLLHILSNGPSKSEDRSKQKIESLDLGIDIKIPLLKQNIALRTKNMLNKSFIQEVEMFVKKYGSNCEQLQTIGYAEVLKFLNGLIKKDELEEQINRATYQLARKQMTWFKRNPNIIWISNIVEAKAAVSDYLNL